MKKKKKTIKKTKQKITKDMAFSEILKKYPETSEVFFKHGMACVGCPMAMQETIKQGSMSHGLDADELVEELNKKINQKKINKKDKKN